MVIIMRTIFTAHNDDFDILATEEKFLPVICWMLFTNTLSRAFFLNKVIVDDSFFFVSENFGFHKSRG